MVAVDLLWATWTVSHEGVHLAASEFRPMRPAQSFNDAVKQLPPMARVAVHRIGIKTWDDFSTHTEDNFLD